MSKKSGIQAGNVRSIHQRPLYQLIILDLGCKEEVYGNVFSSLCEYFTLCSSISGSMRIELISIYTIHDEIECIVPLQRFRMNVQNIITILQQRILQKQTDSDSKSFQDHFSNCVSDVSSQMQSFSSHGNASTKSQATVSGDNQLDVCVITSQQHGISEKLVAESIKEIGTSLIKKVQIFHVNCVEHGIGDMKCSNDSDGSLESETAEILCEYVESVYLENTPISFLNQFKHWLKESGSDDIHLLIRFNTKKDIELNCDILDTLINPILLPEGNKMYIESELNRFHQKNNNASTLTSRVKSIPVFEFQVRSIVKLAGVCESLLFGIPFVVKPTSCWKLEWEDLEKNQNVFSNVCSYLQNKNSALLLEKLPSTTYKPLFLLLPSPGGTMLIKSIATGDIMMPSEAEMTDSNKSVTKNSNIIEQLDQMETLESYNPFNFSCGIFKELLDKIPADDSVKNKSYVGKKPNPYHMGFIEENPPKKESVRKRRGQLQPSAILIPGPSKYIPSFNRTSKQQENTLPVAAKRRQGYLYQDKFPKTL